jgi:2-C-methyl-D-erythritol 2,4-cyclodiphosphate synthase
MVNNFRVGIGYDVHPLIEKRELILGGVSIPFKFGLDGWSDADVLVHAIIESLFGAAALGDIGSHFPPGSKQYKNVSSLNLLKICNEKLNFAGWSISNIDVTVVAEQPRLKEHIDLMRQKIALTLEIDLANISIKASTNNGLGYLGEVKGIAAYAVALIEKIKSRRIK